jgi:Rrf2 family protein
MISQAARYAIRALTYLESLDDPKYVPVRRLGKELDISIPFLAKILNQLVVAGILEAHRGPTGGVRLAVPAEQVSVRRVIIEVDGPDLFTSCVLGLPGCGEATPCPLHDEWAAIRSQCEETFSSQSIALLSRDVGNGKHRLSP